MVSTKLNRISEIALQRKGEQFTSLAHLLNDVFLKETWKQVNSKGVPGVDSVTIEEYDNSLDDNINSLLTRLKSNTYRASPSLRVDIPKGRKETRPLSIPTVEDRLLQKAVARILEAIFEADFQKCSYGFRAGVSPHMALRDLRDQIVCKKTMWIYEVDIKGYFNNVNHNWLMRMVKQRVKDPVILRLIAKWLRAGAMKDGLVSITRQGTPQGGPISCILSNIYLHFVLDIWFERVVKPRLRGESRLIRFVDDFVICFEQFQDALKVRKVLSKRLNKFELSIAEDKTSLIRFGRFAKERSEREGKKQYSFTFLGMW